MSHPQTRRCNPASDPISFPVEDKLPGRSNRPTERRHRTLRFSTLLKSSATVKEPREIGSLQALREAEASCRRCPLFRDATKVVPGEGPVGATLMMVGEQPGDQEDLAGRPFVGPAGRVLDRAIAEAGIDRGAVFVTNAVKHFKFEPRGKRRLHKKPNAYEIEQCRWWNEMERKIVKPGLIFALGATAARSLLGRTVTISKMRGQVLTSNGLPVVVTIHPSYVLRIEDEEAKQTEYERLVADLRFGVATLREHAT
jgi:uracil-DNA glycosylase